MINTLYGPKTCRGNAGAPAMNWSAWLHGYCIPGFPLITISYPVLNAIPTFSEIAGTDIDELFSAEPGPDNVEIIPELRALLGTAVSRAKERIELIESLARRSGEFTNIEYGFLYDSTRHLQSVGYNVEDRRCDSSYYDLLASEARLSSFVAISQR